MKSQAIASFDDKTQPGGFLSRKMSDTQKISIALGWRQIQSRKTSLCEQMLPLQSLSEWRGVRSYVTLSAPGLTVPVLAHILVNDAKR